jgi:hypothetical protein
LVILYPLNDLFGIINLNRAPVFDAKTQRNHGLEAQQRKKILAEDVFVNNFDGQNWDTVELTLKPQINRISGFSSSEIYAYGRVFDNQPPDDSTYHYFLKYNGMNWNIVDQYLYTKGQTDEKFGGYLWSDLTAHRLYSSGDRVWTWNGGQWDIFSDQAGGKIYGSGENNIFVVWSHVYHFNGSTWKTLTNLPKLSWAAVWCLNKSVIISSHFFDDVQKTLIIRGTQN